MSNGIDISLDKVSLAAGTITTINSNLVSKLGEVKTEMEKLKTSWDSDSYDTLIAKFRGLQPKFNDYEAVVKSYSDFLKATVVAYGEAETAINNDAGKFR